MRIVLTILLVMGLQRAELSQVQIVGLGIQTGVLDPLYFITL